MKNLRLVNYMRNHVRKFSSLRESFYTEEHKAMQNTLTKLIDSEINPHVDKWEQDGDYPAHDIFKKLGKSYKMTTAT